MSLFTASKQLSKRFITKFRDLVHNPSDLQEDQALALLKTLPDIYRLTDSEFNEFTFSEFQGNIDPKKLSFLAPEGHPFILLCRQTINGAFAMYNGIGIKKLHKECFITTGASARFPELVVAALQPDALESFARHGFTKLTFQVGDALDLFHRAKPKKADCMGLEIEAFDFNPNGLTEELKACLASEGKSAEGMVITHAGAGTILDAMRMRLPIIVVPNVSLLDNHQEELAAELERQNYVTKTSPRNLARAIRLAAEKAEEPTVSAVQQPRSLPGGVASIADGLVGYEVNMDDYAPRGRSAKDAADIAHEEEVKAMLD